MSKPEHDNHQEQFALSFYEQSPLILKKPVQAIHMGITGGFINKTQRLAFNAMLKNAHDIEAASPDTNHEIYSINRDVLQSMIGYKSTNRKHLRETLMNMMNLKVEWDILNQDGSARWAACVLMPYVEFDEHKVRYSYVSNLKSMLMNPEIYQRLDLRIQSSLRLDASVALYDWVNRFRTNPSKTTNLMTWEQWRWVIYGQIDSESSSLNEYKVFKRDKLNPAIAEINSTTDLQITLEEDKDGGRKVKYLKFIVLEKEIFNAEKKSDQTQEDWNKKLGDMNLTERERKKIIQTYSTDIIKAHYEYTMNRVGDKTKVTLKSIGAYFKNAIKSGYANELVQDQLKKENNQSANIMSDIEEQFRSVRNVEASGLFRELASEERERLIAEYNQQIEIKGAAIPSDPVKRIKRLMLPFYAWYSQKTWGAPTAQELLTFAMHNGSLSINKKHGVIS